VQLFGVRPRRIRGSRRGSPTEDIIARLLELTGSMADAEPCFAEVSTELRLLKLTGSMADV